MAGTDKQITKRKVTMRAPVIRPDGTPDVNEVVDYVRPNFDGEPESSTGFLDAYVADARTRWPYVEVSEEPDAGPAGYDGDTTVPEHLQGKAPSDFDVYGPAATPENALDELLEARGDRPRSAPSLGGGGVGRAVLGSALVTSVLARVGFMANFMVTIAMLVLQMRFAIQTATQKNTVATSYGAAATHAALYSTAGTGTAGTELSGGTPPYARIATAWGAASNGVISTGPHTFNVASGQTVAGSGVHSALTGGTYLDGGAQTSQAFASQGTYALTLTYTQT